MEKKTRSPRNGLFISWRRVMKSHSLTLLTRGPDPRSFSMQRSSTEAAGHGWLSSPRSAQSAQLGEPSESYLGRRRRSLLNQQKWDRDLDCGGWIHNINRIATEEEEENLFIVIMQAWSICWMFYLRDYYWHQPLALIIYNPVAVAAAYFWQFYKFPSPPVFFLHLGFARQSGKRAELGGKKKKKMIDSVSFSLVV